MARIFTSYYAKAAKLDTSNFVLIRISSSMPCWFEKTVYSLPDVFPSWRLISDFKDGRISWKQYEEQYECVLSKLDRDEVLNNILTISKANGDKDVILLCWERSTECHRHLLAKWLDFGVCELYGE